MSGDPAVLGSQRIACFDLPPIEVRFGWWRLTLIIGGLFLLPALIMTLVTVSLISAIQALAVSVVSWILIALVFVLVARHRTRADWSTFASQHGQQLADQLRAALQQSFKRRSRVRDQAATCAQSLRAKYPGTVALVPKRLHEQLTSLAAPTGLLEPEEIGPSFSWGWVISLVGPFIVMLNPCIRVIRGGGPKSLVDLLLLGGAGIYLISIAAVFSSALGERFTMFKTTRGIVRAGPGWIDDHKGRQWTVDDSIMLLRMRKLSKRPSYFAILLGPHGMIVIPVARGDGSAFANLWQRWTTTVPRTDLMAQAGG